MPSSGLGISFIFFHFLSFSFIFFHFLLFFYLNLYSSHFHPFLIPLFLFHKAISWIRKTIEISELDTTESVKEKIVEKVVRQMEGGEGWEWGEVVGWELGVEGGNKVPDGRKVFRFFFFFFFFFFFLSISLFLFLLFPFCFTDFVLAQISHKTRSRTPHKTKTFRSPHPHPSHLLFAIFNRPPFINRLSSISFSSLPSFFFSSSYFISPFSQETPDKDLSLCILLSEGVVTWTLLSLILLLFRRFIFVFWERL